ncbi:MAG: dTDP-glucose 4,6-dehydratase 2 [Firmicutes bacterium ADurb.Bin456]|nr:MAG: dTDP-glucose 4,6-dehydratase 2 [Firmicutes bacterium ADurb.Bin456]
MKHARLAVLAGYGRFTFYRMDLAGKARIEGKGAGPGGFTLCQMDPEGDSCKTGEKPGPGPGGLTIYQRDPLEQARNTGKNPEYGGLTHCETSPAEQGSRGNTRPVPPLQALFREHGVDVVIHLAAQAGVRYSLENPEAYIDSNIVGFFNLLECCRHYPVRHLLYASSSSVYGNNQKAPFAVGDCVDHPVSLYAATKKSNELMAHTYSHLYRIPATGLRFFTVYGPYGRPDMAYFSFTKAILEDRPLKVFNNGDMYRDFTYIDDVVSGILPLIENSPALTTAGVPHKLYNIGNSRPEKLIAAIEDALGKKAVKEFHPMQPGDVYQTYADVSDLARDTGFTPSTPLKEGIRRFVAWYKGFYQGSRGD